MLTEAHEKKEAWKQIWLLTQKNANGQHLYYRNLKPGERNELLTVFYDFLDYERKVELGARLGDADNSELIPDDSGSSTGYHADIHNPDHYLFNEGKVWIPWALDAPSGAKRGKYAFGYPEGLVVHFTAGHRNGLAAGNELMRNTGMLYLLIDKDGNTAQSDPLNYHGYHAGVSSHNTVTGYVSDEFHGVEIQSGGKLETNAKGQFVTWFKSVIRKDQVTAVRKTYRNMTVGYYHKYTARQVVALRRLCVWLYLNNPKIFSIDRVVGHDEVAPGRKPDPGGSIPAEKGRGREAISMPEFRNILWNDVDRVTEARKKK